GNTGRIGPDLLPEEALAQVCDAAVGLAAFDAVPRGRNVGEAEPFAASRHQEVRTRRVGLELGADAANVRNEPFTVVVRGPRPRLRLQLLFRHDTTASASERGEDAELHRRRDQVATVERRAPATEIELERP